MKRYLLLLSGGVGSRYGADLPKQYTQAENGNYYIWDSVKPFNELGDYFEGLIVVCAEEYHELITEIFKANKLKIKLHFAPHGSERQVSINNGVDKINQLNNGEAQVIIQEAVRPFVSTELVEELINVPKDKWSVSPSVNPFVLYSKFNSHTNEATDLMDKSHMVELQLPKRYDLKKYNEFMRLHPGKHANLLDESEYFLNNGVPTFCIKGSFENIKITRPVHRWIAEAIKLYNESVEK